jgi:AraC-like DNA-binding protein
MNASKRPCSALLQATERCKQPPQAFLQRFQACIEQRLFDAKLDLPQIQRLLGMSRSDLHRKLKAATGLSATAYIRHLRLQRAAQLLLEQPEACILGIALEVGFNDHSYFTKRFREVYEVCPGEYRAMEGFDGRARVMRQLKRRQ